MSVPPDPISQAMRAWEANRDWHLTGTNERDCFRAGWEAHAAVATSVLRHAETRLRFALDRALDQGDLGEAQNIFLSLAQLHELLGTDPRERLALGERYRKVMHDAAALGVADGGQGDGRADA